ADFPPDPTPAGHVHRPRVPPAATAPGRCAGRERCRNHGKAVIPGDVALPPHPAVPAASASCQPVAWRWWSAPVVGYPTTSRPAAAANHCAALQQRAKKWSGVGASWILQTAKGGGTLHFFTAG